MATLAATLPLADGYEALFRAHFGGMVRFAALLGADDPAALPYLTRTVQPLGTQEPATR